MARDDWSDKGVYQTLRLIFLRREADESGPIFSVRPRVHDAAGRPVALRFSEWKGVVEAFAIAKSSEYLRPFREGPVHRKSLPCAIDDAMSVPVSTEARLAGYAFFTTNASDNRWARARLKTLSRRGDNASRKKMKRIRL